MPLSNKFIPLSIESLQKRYASLIKVRGGVGVLFQVVLDEFRALYNLNPAKITFNSLKDTPLNLTGTPFSQVTVDQLVAPANSGVCSPMEFVAIDEDNTIYPFDEVKEEEDMIIARPAFFSSTSPFVLNIQNSAQSTPAGALTPATSWFQGIFSPRTSNNSSQTLNARTEQVLPIDWLDLKAANLTEEEFALAMQLYYQHEIHTVIRFLTPINQWADTADRNNSFESHQLRIVLFYLMVRDPRMEHVEHDKIPNEYFFDKLLASQ